MGDDFDIDLAETAADLPPGIDTESLAAFLHESLKPYEDSPADIRKGLSYALSRDPGEGGFVLTGRVDGRLAAALVMLRTGMEGYIPANLLLFVAVDPEHRGRGLGRRIIEHALSRCDGPVKLHVEYENPAKRLYERIGFTSKYAEMRYAP
jgi:GNAT superfamily N-acetyltransferase